MTKFPFPPLQLNYNIMHVKKMLETMTRYKTESDFSETINFFITKNLYQKKNCYKKNLKSYITGLDSNSELASSSWTVNFTIKIIW